MKVYRNLNQILTLQSAQLKGGRNLTPDDATIVDTGAIVFDEHKIHWIGKTADLPAKYDNLPSHDMNGFVLTPGIVDSHTHLVFGGNRSKEYVDRLNGVDYQLIAARGGGILYTMKETLSLSEDQLFAESVVKLDRFIELGVKVIEIKSGYALTSEGELKVLRVIKRLKDSYKNKLLIFSTYLGAHAVPKEFASSRDFLTKVVIPTLDLAHGEGLVDFVDIFVEQGYFSVEDAKLLFNRSKELGLKTRIHADEFTDLGCGALAAEYNCASADHLLKVSDHSIQKLSQSDTVATLLPGTAFFLGKPLAPARKLLDAGCRVALASDYNPGSSHIDNLLLVASLSAPNLKMNLTEVWAAITLNAAFSLGLPNYGYLEVGSASCFSLFKTAQVSDITYFWGRNFHQKSP